MYNFEAIYDKYDLSGVVNFVDQEYSQIDGDNRRKFKISEIYSDKAVINKLIKNEQFDSNFDSADKRRLKQLLKQLTSQYKPQISKQFIDSVKSEDDKYKKRLLIILEKNINNLFNDLLVEYLISCKQIRNYMILPVGKMIGTRTLFQKKANSYGGDSVAFFQALEVEYQVNHEFQTKMNSLYKVSDFRQLLSSLTIDQTILEDNTLRTCLDNQQITNYLECAIKKMDTRNILFAEKYENTVQSVDFNDYNLVLELQKDDPSNKVTLLKVVLVTVGTCISAIPLTTLVEDYEGNWLVSGLMFFSGFAIIIIFNKLLERRKRDKVIDNWFNLFLYYEPILFGLGISFAAIELTPYLFMLAMGLGLFKFLGRII